MQARKVLGAAACAALPVIGFPIMAMAQTQTIRVAAYNIEDDINGATTPLPGLYQVLEGIGEENVLNDVQPLDILALEETTSNATTIAPIVTALNSFYSGTTTNSYTGSNNVHPVYAMSTYQATESGGDVANGNGPNALIYNTSTLNLIASVPVDPPGGVTTLGASSGEYREVMRYEFQPVADTGSNGIFYVYVSHYKSGTTSADLTDRNEEAQIIRNNEAATLPANASVLYVGDYNLGASTEASYQTMLAASSPSGHTQGQAIDPLNPTNASENWQENAAFEKYLSESATDLRYRDDLQLMTTNVYNGTVGGLSYVNGTFDGLPDGSLHAFGNNGTTPVEGNVDSGSNTSLNSDLYEDGSSFISASSLYSYLTTASDHLPVVADYTIAIPEPTSLSLAIFAGGGLLLRPKRRNWRP
jgi:hypothetical protein